MSDDIKNAERSDTTIRTVIKKKEYENDQTITEFLVTDGVQVIRDEAFCLCKQLRKITLPKSLRIIEQNAFAFCIALTEVELNEGLKEIGGSAFEGCSSLSNVVTKEGINIIGEFAFSECPRLTSFEIPDSVAQIKRCVFCCDRAGTESNLKTLTCSLRRIEKFHRYALTNRCHFDDEEYCDHPPLNLETLRLKLPFSRVRSIPFPRNLGARDEGQFVDFIHAQQETYAASELAIANRLWFTCFVLKCARVGLYNAHGGPILARIFRFQFRGRNLPFPIRGADAFRANAALSRSDHEGEAKAAGEQEKEE